MELARRCPVLRYVHLATIDASTLPDIDAATRLGHPLREMLFQHVYNALSSEKRCAAAEVLDVAFPKLDITLSKAQCYRLNARPDTESQWKRILLLVWALRCKRNREHLFSNFGFRAQFAVSTKKSLADVDAALSEAYSTYKPPCEDPYWDSDAPSLPASPRYSEESEWADSSDETDSESDD